MEDTIRVMELLEDLEDVVEGATKVPMMNKVMIEAEEVNNIIKDIRLSLPDDVQQAKWIRDERDRILAEAREEYARIVREAQKQADLLVEESAITTRATKLAQEIKQDAEMQARYLKMKTYYYVDKILYDMQQNMDMMNTRYIGAMYASLDDTFNQINALLKNNREEITHLAEKTQSEINSGEEQ